jgi:hypothetical protein
MVIEPPAAIPGQFVPRPGLEQLVTIERGEPLQRQELAARSALDSAVHDLGDAPQSSRRCCSVAIRSATLGAAGRGRPDAEQRADQAEREADKHAARQDPEADAG